MRPLRSVVALASTGAVMGCQTIAGAGSAATPVSSAYSSAAVPTASIAQLATMPAQENAKSKSYAMAEMGGSRRKMVLIVAVVAAIVVAAIVIGGSDSGSSY